MNDIELWVMSLLFVPSVDGGNSRTINISFANYQALYKLERNKMIFVRSLSEIGHDVTQEDAVYSIKLRDEGLEFMQNYCKLPPLKVGSKLEYLGSNYTYAFKEEKRNGEVIIWMRNWRRELRGVPAKMVNFA